MNTKLEKNMFRTQLTETKKCHQEETKTFVSQKQDMIYSSSQDDVQHGTGGMIMRRGQDEIKSENSIGSPTSLGNYTYKEEGSPLCKKSDSELILKIDSDDDIIFNENLKRPHISEDDTSNLFPSASTSKSGTQHFAGTQNIDEDIISTLHKKEDDENTESFVASLKDKTPWGAIIVKAPNQTTQESVTSYQSDSRFGMQKVEGMVFRTSVNQITPPENNTEAKGLKRTAPVDKIQKKWKTGENKSKNGKPSIYSVNAQEIKKANGKGTKSKQELDGLSDTLKEVSERLNKTLDSNALSDDVLYSATNRPNKISDSEKNGNGAPTSQPSTAKSQEVQQRFGDSKELTKSGNSLLFEEEKVNSSKVSNHLLRKPGQNSMLEVITLSDDEDIPEISTIGEYFLPKSNVNTYQYSNKRNNSQHLVKSANSSLLKTNLEYSLGSKKITILHQWHKNDDNSKNLVNSENYPGPNVHTPRVTSDEVQTRRIEIEKEISPEEVCSLNNNIPISHRKKPLLRSTFQKIEQSVSVTSKKSTHGSQQSKTPSQVGSQVSTRLRKTKREGSILLSQDAENIKRPPKRMSQRDRIKWLHRNCISGVWVECTDCKKWRYLRDNPDPQTVPKLWKCYMNNDEEYNRCIKPISPNFVLDNLIDNEYTCGSIVLAQLDGWPWWPAMVDDDPEFEQYYWLAGTKRLTHYHVTFFDSAKVTRAWISISHIRPFSLEAVKSLDQTSLMNENYNRRLSYAIEQAKQAWIMPIAARLEKFSFIIRFKGPVYNYKKGLDELIKKRGLEPIEDSD